MEWFDCTEKAEKRVFEKLVSSHFETGNPLILKNFTHAIRPQTKAGVFYDKWTYKHWRFVTGNQATRQQSTVNTLQVRTYLFWSVAK